MFDRLLDLGRKLLGLPSKTAPQETGFDGGGLLDKGAGLLDRHVLSGKENLRVGHVHDPHAEKVLLWGSPVDFQLTDCQSFIQMV